MSGAKPQNRLFRKTALERLSTPDQLDQLVTVNGPRTWLATLLIVALLSGAIGWSVVGTIPSYVTGDGMLVERNGGVFAVVAPQSGRITALHVQVADQVRAGDIVGRLDQPEIEVQLKQAQDVVTERAEALQKLQKLFAEEADSSHLLRHALRRNLSEFLQSAQERQDDLTAQMIDMDKLEAGGLVVRDRVVATRDRLRQSEQDVRSTRSELIALDLGASQLSARQERELLASETQLQDARRERDRLQSLLERTGTLRAEVSGRVSEVKATVGMRVTTDQAILSLAQGQGGLEGVVFLPSDTGKSVELGQSVALQPANIKKEEFGGIIGTVASISQYPVSPERIRAIVQNESLVQRFSAQGPQYIARIDLDTDVTTASGLRWTSGNGPPTDITAGSLANAEIIVRRRKPIELVIPALRKYTGLTF
ncbi:NHLP bacteriocin system secretion protein [Puniceibacterium sediminis]|uniref:HlyD family secretion protein n=1 Tax=Puniceibacterium sediminis TaxID=1608407 RepID=A0A238ZKH9_9RHOB|nr:NHLP bacteriocin system secretion protein [Puniceibacterium sediminis]SNR83183.1 HlyD family secretion protein [Puniceibacterium sediminis]